MCHNPLRRQWARQWQPLRIQHGPIQPVLFLLLPPSFLFFHYPLYFNRFSPTFSLQLNFFLLLTVQFLLQLLLYFIQEPPRTPGPLLTSSKPSGAHRTPSTSSLPPRVSDGVRAPVIQIGSLYHRALGRHGDQRCFHYQSMEVSVAMFRYSPPSNVNVGCCFSESSCSAVSRTKPSRDVERLQRSARLREWAVRGETGRFLTQSTLRWRNPTREQTGASAGVTNSSAWRNPMRSSEQGGAESDAFFWQKVGQETKLGGTNITDEPQIEATWKRSGKQLSLPRSPGQGNDEVRDGAQVPKCPVHLGGPRRKSCDFNRGGRHLARRLKLRVAQEGQAGSGESKRLDVVKDLYMHSLVARTFFCT